MLMSTIYNDAFNKITIIKQNMIILENNIDLFLKTFLKIQTEVNPSVHQKITNDISNVISTIQKQIMDINSDLAYIKKIYEIIDSTTKQTVIKNIYTSLVQKMIDHISSFDDHYLKYKQFVDKQINRETLVKGSNEIQTFDNHHSQATTKLQIYRNTYKDIKLMESSIAELKQLFVQALILTHSQGELVDNIEHNIQKSVRNIKRGNKQLESAKIKSSCVIL